jgi:glycerol-3-phosphate acyltransferase PlsY
VDILALLPVAVAGYLLGSIPMGVLLAKVFGWPDPRHHGSGHTGALNVSRGAGWPALILVMAADLLKGAAAIWLAGQMSADVWAVTVGGITAVIGHNWPVWLRFSGGMGLATAFGVVLPISPLTALAAGLALVVLRLFVIKHSPRAVIASMAVVPPVMALLHEPLHIFVLGTGAALIIALRHTADWNRVYRKDS